MTIHLSETTDSDYAAFIAGETRDLPIAPGGLGDPGMLSMLRNLAADIRQTFSPSAWSIISDGEIVGLLSLVKTPGSSGMIEIGYGVAESRRRRGHCREAVAAFLAWAGHDPRVRSIEAETGDDNPPSRRVLEHNGFKQIGSRIDPEDGPVTRWRFTL
ncbi:hypothetical protein BH10PSE7_BH10PSE7_03500 [soil metagenome]